MRERPTLAGRGVKPALVQKTLHDHLESYRINRIKQRKEFLRVELSWIINEVEHNYGQVEYIADPVALQYLQNLEYAESEVTWCVSNSGVNSMGRSP